MPDPAKPHVLVTRPVETANELLSRLQAVGFTVTHEPVLQFEQVDSALPKGSFDAIILTSANAVPWLDNNWAQDRQIRIVTTGDGTSKAARDAGFFNIATTGGSVEKLARELPENLIRLHDMGKPLRVLYPRAETTAQDLRNLLENQNLALVEVIAYAMQERERFSRSTEQLFQTGGIDIVTLFSSRSAKAFASQVYKWCGSEGAVEARREKGFRCVVMSRAVRDALPAWIADQAIVAKQPSLDAMIDAIMEQSRHMGV